MKIAPHLHRIGNEIVAAYLIDAEDGVTLIDAGLPGHWRDFRKELVAMGRTLDDVRGVVLTHGDSDHIGFAERLRREKGVPVYIHAADAERAKGAKKPKTVMGRMKLGPLLGFVLYGMRKGGLRTRYLKELVEVHDGEVLPLPGAPVVVSMPGHSPGSIAVHVPLADAVFVGDALTTRDVLTGHVGPAPAPFTDAPDEALESLAHLADIKASWVLPGHGAPWKVDPAHVHARVREAARRSDAQA